MFEGKPSCPEPPLPCPVDVIAETAEKNHEAEQDSDKKHYVTLLRKQSQASFVSSIHPDQPRNSIQKNSIKTMLSKKWFQ